MTKCFYSEDKYSAKAEARLKRSLFKTKGQFKLCLVDADIIDEQLTKAFKIKYTPSMFLFYKANVASEHRGNPTKE